MTAPTGVLVYETTERAFDQRFTKVVNVPVEQAAQSYVRAALLVGASIEALEELGKHTKITKEEFEMAKKNLPALKSGETTKAKNPATTKAKAAKGPSAASRFKELIMAGKLTDDELFAKVQEEFKLSDDKRRYVAWYRNDLKKTGQNPPEPKAPKAVKKDK
jgi:hypothetical protein